MTKKKKRSGGAAPKTNAPAKKAVAAKKESMEIPEAEGLPKPEPQAEEVVITPVEKAPKAPAKKKKVSKKVVQRFIY